MDYNFDFGFIKKDYPKITLSKFGIYFNKACIDLLNCPEQIVIGYDKQNCSIGIKDRGEDKTSPYYKFSKRATKNGNIRIGAKDFVIYLSKISGIDFLSKPKKFNAFFEESTKTLIIEISEKNLAKD